MPSPPSKTCVSERRCSSVTGLLLGQPSPKLRRSCLASPDNARPTGTRLNKHGLEHPENHHEIDDIRRAWEAVAAALSRTQRGQQASFHVETFPQTTTTTTMPFSFDLSLFSRAAMDQGWTGRPLSCHPICCRREKGMPRHALWGPLKPAALTRWNEGRGDDGNEDEDEEASTRAGAGRWLVCSVAAGASDFSPSLVGKPRYLGGMGVREGGGGY